MRTAVAAAAAAATFLTSLFPLATASVVEAGTLTTVTVDAPVFDTNLSNAGGCDPAGCVGDFTRDNDATDETSRWSCKPDLSASLVCSITYTFEDPLTLVGLAVAMYEGDERVRTMEVYVDDALITTWASSGTTTDLEAVDFDVVGETVELRGVLDNSEWLSILEVEIMADDGDDSTTNLVEAGSLGTVVTTARVYDTNVASANGCDPAGCTADLTRDRDFTEGSRWSCKPDLGGPCTISYDLGAVRELSQLRLAMFKGTTRMRTMDILVDDVLVTTWTSSGSTEELEDIDLSETEGQVITVTGVLENSEWLSIIEAEILVVSTDDGSTPPTPAPSLTPAPTNIDSPPEGELQPVGLTSLAYGDGTDVEASYAKDGDFSTVWACTGDFSRTFTAQCDLNFKLDYYRRIKQIKIAASDGDGGAVDMMITGRTPNFEAGDNFELTVSSSGSTDGFEIFEFDFLTRTIEIDSLFTSTGQTLTISEIEFVEEVQEGFLPVASFSTPDVDQLPVPGGFAFISESADTLGEDIGFGFGFFVEITAIELQFPVGDTYKFDVQLDIEGEDADVEILGFESADVTGWQKFDVSQSLSTGQIVAGVGIIMQGTGSGATGFSLLDARFEGEIVANPTDVFTVGSARIEGWTGGRYPDFVGSGTGDQQAIQAAICAVKKASFDGVDCVGGDPDATGTVELSMGSYYIDGNIFLKSGVHLEGQFSIDDAPNETRFILEEGAGGKTDVAAMVVIDGVTNAIVEDLFIFGLYEPPTSTAGPAVAGLGSTGISVTNSEDITCKDIWVTNIDGDAVVLRDSVNVNVDAGRFDEEFLPFAIAESRGTGLVVDNCENVWVRRHAMFDNGEAGIHIVGSSNFTFEATFDSSLDKGDGLVGSLDGQQPIEVIVESSVLVTFQDLEVVSNNEPVMTVSADSSSVSCNNCGFSSVEAGTCVIQTEDPAVVSVVDDELTLDGTCYVKV